MLYGDYTRELQGTRRSNAYNATKHTKYNKIYALLIDINSLIRVNCGLSK